jgi:Na+-transporting methylmalonyl-CoA/oxaloacetate decarboxylase gamma subunit
MLTNNKKSYFVKSIAMIMAVLMVLAVCLTGCGNKAAEEAAQKAENAQTTATEAKTAADAVKASLEEYLKKADAVTVAAVTAEIEKALGGYAKTADLADFVKSGDLTRRTGKKHLATVFQILFHIRHD